MTYSIVARDAHTGALAVACQSHFFAPGASVTWAEPGVGAIATQAFVNGEYGARGLELLAAGRGAQETLVALLESDPHPEVRQVAIVAHDGEAAVWTGQSCIEVADGISDGPVAVQGNMLANDQVLPAMLEAYQRSSGDLAERVVEALQAAENAGGDVRGSQGASLLVVDGDVTDQPWSHKPVDLRVEDHRDPVGELHRLLEYRRAFDAVSGTMFAPGLMVGPYTEPSPGAYLNALAALDRAAEIMAPNPEALFWKSILMARAGAVDTAGAQLRSLYAVNPRLKTFTDRLAEAGFLTDETLAGMQ